MSRAHDVMAGRLLPACMVVASAWLTGCLDHDLATGDEVEDKTSYIALQRDFEGFRDWMAFELEDDVHSDVRGTIIVYLNRLPEPGAKTFPVGTLIVKTTEDSAGKTTLHAMSKRGSDYNSRGALGWEYFELVYDEDDVPVIAWRGQAPPDGESYQALPGGKTMEADCNGCHVSSKNDAVLDDMLDLKEL